MVQSSLFLKSKLHSTTESKVSLSDFINQTPLFKKMVTIEDDLGTYKAYSDSYFLLTLIDNTVYISNKLTGKEYLKCHQEDLTAFFKLLQNKPLAFKALDSLKTKFLAYKLKKNTLLGGDIDLTNLSKPINFNEFLRLNPDFKKSSHTEDDLGVYAIFINSFFKITVVDSSVTLSNRYTDQDYVCCRWEDVSAFEQYLARNPHVKKSWF